MSSLSDDSSVEKTNRDSWRCLKPLARSFYRPMAWAMAAIVMDALQTVCGR